MVILIINICKERLHYFEFVKPIEDILRNNNIIFFTKHYLELKQKDLEKADKVIICGTSLMDFGYFNNLNKFEMLKDFEKPVFGICAGMQIICALFGGRLFERGKKILDRKEIGMEVVHFEKSFLGFNGNVEAYLLHQMGVGVGKSEIEAFAFSNKGLQAMRYKNFYGVLFHPEVRNKKMIEEFVKNG